MSMAHSRQPVLSASVLSVSISSWEQTYQVFSSFTAQFPTHGHDKDRDPVVLDHKTSVGLCNRAHPPCSFHSVRLGPSTASVLKSGHRTWEGQACDPEVLPQLQHCKGCRDLPHFITSRSYFTMAPTAGCPAMLSRPQPGRATHTCWPLEDFTQLLISAPGSLDIAEPTAKPTTNVTAIFYNLLQGKIMEYGPAALPAFTRDVYSI